MSLHAQAEFLAERVERPIYYASSAGRNATHEIDQPMNQVEVEVNDARARADADSVGEFGMHASGFDLLEFPTRMQDFLDAKAIASSYEAEVEAFLKSVETPEALYPQLIRELGDKVKQAANADPALPPDQPADDGKE